MLINNAVVRTLEIFGPYGHFSQERFGGRGWKGSVLLNTTMAIPNIFFPLDLSVTHVCGHGQKIKESITCGIAVSKELELVSGCLTIY